MHLKFRNVNEAFVGIVRGMTEGSIPTVRTTSRNGAVIQCVEPMTFTYSHPRERVLFNAVRDANPFMHLYETLWMLAGRNDVAPVAYYASNMRQFSDDGKTLNGAYGYRWRCAQGRLNLWLSKGNVGPIRGYNRPGVDQLNLLVSHLRSNPDSRRAVLTMWNVEDDLLRIGSQCSCGVRAQMTVDCPVCKGIGITPASKDVCCNLNVMFSLRKQRQEDYDDFEHWIHSPSYALDMTVTNRSNDLVWGMLGANYVHMTFLQEYMAARLGAEVGLYHHVTNNLHAYCDRADWKPAEWLDWEDDADRRVYDYCERDEAGLPDYVPFHTVPLVQGAGHDADWFDQQVQLFCETWPGADSDIPKEAHWSEPFLETVAKPMMRAFRIYKMSRDPANAAVRHAFMREAIEACRHVAATDWRLAATDWLTRRKDK